MINMNVKYISNEDLLFKSFCRIINPTLVMQDHLMVVDTNHLII